MRLLPPALAVLGLILGAPASAQPDPSMTASKTCTARTAKAVDSGAIGADPAAFAGQCVKLQGWWKDIGFYPTRAEAAVVDSLSMPLLDNRRIGLYLSKKAQEAAPQGPKLATVIGTVGACANLSAAVTAADTGYCHYEGGAFLAVSKIGLAR